MGTFATMIWIGPKGISPWRPHSPSEDNALIADAVAGCIVPRA